MDHSEIKSRAEALGLWYHEIELFPGYKTKSCMEPSKPIWEIIRKVREKLNYNGKSVLDIGTMNGMWAFEAEKLGASPVVASDIWQGGCVAYMKQFMFAHEALDSACEIVVDADAHHLKERLLETMERLGIAEGFDIIQCLGMLYHAEHPWLVLNRIRECLKPGGKLLLETAVWTGGSWTEPAMRFNSDDGIYCDKTTFWAPNWRCLLDMLIMAKLRPELDHVENLQQKFHRVCLIATAV